MPILGLSSATVPTAIELGVGYLRSPYGIVCRLGGSSDDNLKEVGIVCNFIHHWNHCNGNVIYDNRGVWQLSVNVLNECAEQLPLELRWKYQIYSSAAHHYSRRNNDPPRPSLILTYNPKSGNHPQKASKCQQQHQDDSDKKLIRSGHGRQNSRLVIAHRKRPDNRNRCE